MSARGLRERMLEPRLVDWTRLHVSMDAVSIVAGWLILFKHFVLLVSFDLQVG